MSAGFICLEAYWTICDQMYQTLTTIAAVVSIILWIPLLPFVCIWDLLCSRPKPRVKRKEYTPIELRL